MNPVYVQGYTYIIFILICMYMNFHTFQNENPSGQAGVLLSLQSSISRTSLEVQIFYGAFSLKELGMLCLCQAGIVYKEVYD